MELTLEELTQRLISLQNHLCLTQDHHRKRELQYRLMDLHKEIQQKTKEMGVDRG